MKEKSLVKNFIYNFIYHAINLFFPLITLPYVSRTLGPSNLGIVNFATILVNWFVLFAVFGTTFYGIREVAKNKEDKEKLNTIFSEIFVINGAMSIIVSIIYFMVIFSFEKFHSDLTLYIIMSLYIILSMFAMDWLYQGIEEYRYITIRNAFIKLVSLVSIFLFIQNTDDYLVYGLISVLATSLNGILNYIYSRNFVKIRFKNINPSRHFKKISIFFFHALIVNLYTNFDQVLLGFLVNTSAVAFMFYSKVITSTAILISNSISNVTLPRASYYFKNDLNKFKELIKKVPNYILITTIPLTFGIVALSKNIMFILGGEEFLKASLLLSIISFIIIFSSLATWLHQQILIPIGMEKIGTISAVIISIISLVLNIILIPKIGYIGAAISQVLAEIGSMLIKYLAIRYYLSYKEVKFINPSTIKYCIAAISMYIIVSYINYQITSMLIGFIVGAITGIITYLIILLIMKEKIVLEILNRFKSHI